MVETEFGNVLAQIKRENNNLSHTIRGFWDEGHARITTRNNPIHVDDALVSILGHITPDEVRRDLRAVDTSNGFCNRFLWVLVRRSKCIPNPQPLEEHVLTACAGAIRERIEAARLVGRVQRDAAAAHAWDEGGLYRRLKVEMPSQVSGVLRSFFTRGAPEVTRLAMVYALVDGSNIVTVQHQAAAVALWEYVARSIRHIFGGLTGNTTADRIAHALTLAGEDGLSRTEISLKVCKGNAPAETIKQALKLLSQLQLAHKVKAIGKTRSAEIWYAGPAPRG